MPRLPRTVVTLLGLTVLAACGPGEPPGEVTLELGTGESDFEPLVDRQEVPLVFGPQGGHHVWISFRATGLSSERVLMDLDMVPLAMIEPPARAEPVRIFTTLTDEGQVFVGWPAQILRAGCYVGVPISVRVELTDTAGNVVNDERVVIPTSAEALPCEE